MRRPYLHGNIEFNNVREGCSNYVAGVYWEVSINALTVWVANRITAVCPSWLQVPSYAKKWGTINISQGTLWLNLWIQCNSFLCVNVTFMHKLFSPVRRQGKPKQTKWNNAVKKHFHYSLDQRKQTADLLPTLCPTALSPKPWANITNYSLVQTLLINGAGRPGLRELTKQTWHGVLLYIFIPSVFLWGCERLVVWVRSMAHCGLLSSITTAVRDKMSRDLLLWSLMCYSTQSKVIVQYVIRLWLHWWYLIIFGLVLVLWSYDFMA